MILKYFKNKIKILLNNEYYRNEWVRNQLAMLREGSIILDAGCGSQQYRKYCEHLKYYAQDFGQYKTDSVTSFAASSTPYEYGKLDYTGDIWNINESDQMFDAILCTEVFEHIPYPIETLKEFSRLLKPGGQLILTFPSNSLRHMDPYWFYAGFSDRFIDHFLKKYGFEKVSITVNGDYYKWIMVEIYRTIKKNGMFSWLFLLPAFIYFYMKQLKPTQESVSTLCFGYQISARKI